MTNHKSIIEEVEKGYEATFACLFGGVSNGCPCCVNAKAFISSAITKAARTAAEGEKE